jgi:hypothetical protein
MQRYTDTMDGQYMSEAYDGRYCLFSEAELELAIVPELAEALRFLLAHCQNNKQIAGVVSLAKEALDHAERKASGKRDDLRDQLAAAKAELAKLRAVVERLPTKDAVELAIRANNAGGLELKADFCTCDASVGMSPCMYCAIDVVLRSVLKTVTRAAAERGGEAG